MSWLSIFGMCIIPFFLFFTYTTMKFTLGNESKSERGKRILHASYKYSIPVFPIGWLLIEGYHRVIQAVAFDMYREYMVILILLLFIAQGLSIIILKRTTEVAPA
ncbi:hypothetical protein NCCP2222_32660 [Sporosarcina sp. NCCP-2222]|uniref:hypothetical protein n=1 Tax=Sporosarcina sp. NCCP-2222 TaxID=2935073 RepID=UPI00207F4D80|nr:hypothetical protein [Sporosarcina sp. NCCP-2222]GKV57319.1 hypothetical protein NCCP2222_32660 [Sporosarcina sp. NCCP-2222]